MKVISICVNHRAQIEYVGNTRPVVCGVALDNDKSGGLACLIFARRVLLQNEREYRYYGQSVIRPLTPRCHEGRHRSRISIG